MRGVGRRVAAALLLIVVAICVLWVGRLLSHKGLDWAAKFSEVASLVLAAAGLLVTPFGKIAQWLRGPQPATPEGLASATDRLQAALSAAWAEEGSQVYDDMPMQVRFVRWPEAVIPRLRPGASSSEVAGAEQRLAGDFYSVVDAFGQEPRNRRVILGDAGAGKTVLVMELQRKLLEVLAPGDPLPVIVPAAAWRPDQQSLLDWLADQLATDYAWLPVSHARALVAGGKIMPILDGLDEMPSWLWPGAIARINEHRVYRPLVVTSREDAYRDAVRQNRRIVKDIAVVAVKPLPLSDIWAYLDPTGGGAWAGVLGEMQAKPGEALASVLANPLMLWLARVVYDGKDPSGLTVFGGRTAIENHLLEEFVPTVYADDSGWPAARQFRCTARQAQRWLGYLSWDSYVRHRFDQGREDDPPGSPTLAWWQFSDVAGSWRVLGIGLRAALLWSVAAILGVWVLAQHGYWRHGAYSGPVNWDDLLLGGQVGRYIQRNLNQLAAAVPQHVRNQAQAAPGQFLHATGGVFSGPFLLALLAAILLSTLATATSDFYELRVPVRLRIRAMPALAQALKSCCLLLAVAALGSLWLLHRPQATVSTGAFYDARATWISLLAVSLIGLRRVPSSFIQPSDISGNLSPPESLRLDRQTDIIVTVSRRSASAVLLYLFCGQQIALAYVLYAITATLVALTFGGQHGFASRSYLDARVWLALQRRLPWRAMAFLADAGRRGVLRQVGAGYQFRHARLLEQAEHWRNAASWERPHRRIARRKVPDLVSIYAEAQQPEELKIREDAARFLQVAQSSSNPLPSGFAADLDDLAHRLQWLRGEQASAARRDLLDAYWALAETDPATFKPHLASALWQLASAFPPGEELRLSKEAADLYRTLAEANPAAFLPDFAKAVSNLAGLLYRLERLDDMSCLTKKATETCRKLAETGAVEYLPVLTKPLRTLGDRLLKTQPETAIDALREVTAVYRKLADTHSPKFRPDLTSSLDNLASSFKTLGRPQDELAVIREALDVSRKRAEFIAEIRHQIKAADPGLAILLQPGQQSDSGRPARSQVNSGEWKTALVAARKALTQRAKHVPAEFLPDLAEAADGLAIELKAARKRRESQILTDEADRIWPHRRSRKAQREAWNLQSLERMDELALRLWKLGELNQALAADQARRELTPASHAHTAAAGPKRAWPAQLITLYREEETTWQWRGVARSSRRSVWFWSTGWRKLSREKPATAQHFLVTAQQRLADALEKQSDALDTLAFRRMAADRSRAALSATRNAVETQETALAIYRELASRLQPGDQPDLTRLQGILALRQRAHGVAEAATAPSHDASQISGGRHPPTA